MRYVMIALNGKCKCTYDILNVQLRVRILVIYKQNFYCLLGVLENKTAYFDEFYKEIRVCGKGRLWETKMD